MTHNLYLIIHIRVKSPSRRDRLAVLKILINEQLFGFTLTENFLFDNPNAPRSIQESIAGIVLPKEKSAFSATCKHTIGFVHSLCHKIIDHDTNVGILTTEN